MLVQRRTMLYKSVHHLELAVQGLIKQMAPFFLSRNAKMEDSILFEGAPQRQGQLRQRTMDVVGRVEYIVLFSDPRHPSANSTSRLRGHSVGRRDRLLKGLDVGEVSIVTGSRRRTIHPLTG